MKKLIFFQIIILIFLILSHNNLFSNYPNPCPIPDPCVDCDPMPEWVEFEIDEIPCGDCCLASVTFSIREALCCDPDLRKQIRLDEMTFYWDPSASSPCVRTEEDCGVYEDVINQIPTKRINAQKYIDVVRYILDHASIYFTGNPENYHDDIEVTVWDQACRGLGFPTGLDAVYFVGCNNQRDYCCGRTYSLQYYHKADLQKYVYDIRESEDVNSVSPDPCPHNGDPPYSGYCEYMCPFFTAFDKYVWQETIINGVNDKINDAEQNVEVIPNPADNELRIDFTSKESSVYQIDIYNILGQPVLGHDEYKDAGKVSIKLLLTDLPKGVYFINISTINQLINKSAFIKM